MNNNNPTFAQGWGERGKSTYCQWLGWTFLTCYRACLSVCEGTVILTRLQHDTLLGGGFTQLEISNFDCWNGQ